MKHLNLQVHRLNQKSVTTFKNSFSLLLFMLIVRTQIKEIMKKSGLGVENISGDYMDKLDAKAKELILDSLKRAKENGRRTVMGKDV